jgi:hypothetical protein
VRLFVSSFVSHPLRKVCWMQGQPNGPTSRLGPRYDNTLRLLLFGSSETLAEFITGKPAAEFEGSRYGETELPGTTLSVDTLVETSTQRLHIEIQTRANATEFEPRLVEYAARLNRNGLPLEHHVLVLNPIGGRLSGTYKRGGLSLVYHAHHLWDYPAEELLGHPTFYPLAVLGDATSQKHRAEILESAIQNAQQMNTTAEVRSRTINIAATLATIHLAAVTIEAILERTKPMTVTLAEIYEDAVKDRYLEQGREQGRAQGLEQGREERERSRLQSNALLLALAEKCHGKLSDRLVSLLSNSTLLLGDRTNLVLQAQSASELESLITQDQ